MPAPWSRPERNALRDLWRRGLKPSVIATSLQAQFGHRYRAADIPGRARDFGFLAEHPAAPAEPEPPPAVVSPPPVEEPADRPQPAAWSEQAVERLTTMWRDGATGPAIAAALTQEFGTPRSRSAVMGMVHRLGLKGQQGRLAEEPAAGPGEPSSDPGGPVASPGEALSDAPQALSSEAEALSSPPDAPPPAPVLTVVRPEPRPADWPPADGIPMADLRWGECRWPVSEFRAVQHRFCAARATGDSPYCAEHRRRATTPREMGRGPGRYPGWVDGGVA
jgi:hypothetical protein